MQMITGTGKTRMAATLVCCLLKADYANSVLFLIDRSVQDGTTMGLSQCLLCS